MKEYEKTYKGFYDGITVKIFNSNVKLLINKYDIKSFATISFNEIIYDKDTLVIFLFDYNKDIIATFDQVKFIIDYR